DTVLVAYGLRVHAQPDRLLVCVDQARTGIAVGGADQPFEPGERGAELGAPRPGDAAEQRGRHDRGGHQRRSGPWEIPHTEDVVAEQRPGLVAAEHPPAGSVADAERAP